MITRRYRIAGHAVAACLLAGIAVVATGAGAGAASGDTASRPDSYGGDATASSMQFQITRNPFPLPAVTDPFHVWAPYASTSTDSSGGSDGTAASLYPGADFIGAPDLICVFAAALCNKLPGGGFPKYPDYAYAQYPAHPDSSAKLSQKPFPGTGPFEVTPNNVEAHADRDRVEATTVTGSSGLEGVVTVQQSTAHSLQKFEGSTLVITTESVLRGIDIGGQLHIDQIRSTATGKIDGTKVGTATAETTVSGATLAGQGVVIDNKGIHAGPGDDKGQAKQQINAALAKLASQGIDVRSLGTTKSAKPTKITAQSGGLLLTSKKPVSVPNPLHLPVQPSGDYLLTVGLGGAGINAYASPANPLGGDIPLPTVPTTGSGAAPPAAAPTGTSSLPEQATTDTPAGQQPAVASGGQKPAALPIDLTNKRLKTLALVLLAYPLLILATAPFRAPARLPRGR